MTQVQILPPAAKFLKKLKDKKLKSLYKEAIEMICEDYSIGEEKTGNLTGMYDYDIYYNKTNYELAYRVRQLDDLIIIIIMAGTRENFLAAISLLSFLVLSRVVHFNFFKCFFYFS